MQPGRRADLVLLAQSPLANIANTRKIAGVMVRGRWLSHEVLEENLEQIPAIYQRELLEVEHDLEMDPEKAKRFLEENDPFDRLGAAAMLATTREMRKSAACGTKKGQHPHP